jgi:hypothetical protein
VCRLPGPAGLPPRRGPWHGAHPPVPHRAARREAVRLTVGDVDLPGPCSHSRHEVREAGSCRWRRIWPPALSLPRRCGPGPRAAPLDALLCWPHWPALYRRRFPLHLSAGACGHRPPRQRGDRGPRLHDLRHSFATLRLLLWYEQAADLGTQLPLLATSSATSA